MSRKRQNILFECGVYAGSNCSRAVHVLHHSRRLARRGSVMCGVCCTARATTRRERRWNRNLARWRRSVIAPRRMRSGARACVSQCVCACHARARHTTARPTQRIESEWTCTACASAGAPPTFVLPRVRWSSHPTLIPQKLVIALSRHTLQKVKRS